MKRRTPWRRILTALAALAGLGLLAAAALIKALFPADEARAFVVDAARRKLGREVRLEGVEAGLRGVSLRGLEISARPDFAAGTFLRAESVRVQPNWRALLERRFVISDVTVDHPIVFVERHRDGRFDFSAARSSAVAISKTGPAPELDVRRLTVADGEVDYVDDASSASWRATELSLEVLNLHREAPLSVELSARVRGTMDSRAVDARVAVDASVDPGRARREKFVVDATRIVIEQDGLRLAGSARVSGLDAPRVGVEAELRESGRRLAQASLSARFGPAVDVAARVETAPLGARTLAQLLPDSRLPDLPAAALTGRFSLAGGDLLVPTAVLSAAGGRIAVSGRIVDAQSGAPTPELSADVDWSLPKFPAGSVYFLSGLPAKLIVPALRVSGRMRWEGPDAIFDGLTFAPRAGSVVFNGRIADVLSGAAHPRLSAALDLALPPLTDADLPFPGVPAGLRLPATHWTGTIGYMPGVLRLRALRARTGRTDVQADGDVALKPRTNFTGRLRARSLDFGELGALTRAARAFKPSGGGSFDFRFQRGPRGRVVLGMARLRGMSLDAGGIPLRDLSGMVIADGSRIEAPNLVGSLDGAALALDLAVDDYTRAPEIRVAAKLERFDLGHYLAAKRKMLSENSAFVGSTVAVSGASPAPIRTRGSLDIVELVHPNATVRDVHADWILTGVTPDLRALGGRARLRVGGGRIRSLGALADEEKVLKVLLFPLLIVQKITSLGGLRLFPDFNDIKLRSVAGDYSFKKGVMTLEHSRMESNEAAVAAAGTIDLPLEKLGLVVRAQVAAFVPIAVDVGGTFSRPTAKVGAGAFIVDPAKQLLLDMLGR